MTVQSQLFISASNSAYWWLNALQTKKVKIKKSNLNIDLDTINRRLDVLGPPNARNLDIKVDGGIEGTAFPRAFLSDTWGGNRVATFPTIGSKKMKEHPYRNFCYPNSDYNPVSNRLSIKSNLFTDVRHYSQAAPLIAGAAGLMFFPDGIDVDIDDNEEDPTEYRLIVKLPQSPAIWIYAGQYRMLLTASLTKAEWLSQSPKVRASSW